MSNASARRRFESAWRLANDPGTTAGERRAAQAAMDRMSAKYDTGGWAASLNGQARQERQRAQQTQQQAGQQSADRQGRSRTGAETGTRWRRAYEQANTGHAYDEGDARFWREFGSWYDRMERNRQEQERKAYEERERQADERQRRYEEEQNKAWGFDPNYKPPPPPRYPPEPEPQPLGEEIVVLAAGIAFLFAFLWICMLTAFIGHGIEVALDNPAGISNAAGALLAFAWHRRDLMLQGAAWLCWIWGVGGGVLFGERVKPLQFLGGVMAGVGLFAGGVLIGPPTPLPY